MPSLTHQALKGALWSFFQRGGQQIIRFGVTIVLARLLAPEVFGLLAMLEVFLLVSEKFIHAGFGAALIQKKEVTRTDLNTLFYYNLAVSIVCYGVLFASAPWIARFYDQPDLAAILRVSALGLICMGFQVVQTVLFTRRMDFRTPTLISMAGLVVSAVTGIWMAVHGHGVWSLVWSGLAKQATELVATWVVCSWRPSLEFSVASFRQISGYGVPILTSSVLDGFFNNIHAVIVGKYYSAADLGFFNRGRAVQSIAMDTATQPLLGVLFPSFSRNHHDPERMAAAYLRVLRMVAFILFPMLFAVAALAEPLILLVYTEEWRASIPFLYWLALFGPWIPLSTVAFSAIKSLGDGMGFLRMSLSRHLLIVVAIALTFRFGIVAIIIGIGCAQALVFYSVTRALARKLPISAIEVIRAVAPSMILAGATHAVVILLQLPQEVPLFVSFLFSTGLFASIYATLVIGIRVRALRETLETTRPFWSRWKPTNYLFSRLCAWSAN